MPAQSNTPTTWTSGIDCTQMTTIMFRRALGCDHQEMYLGASHCLVNYIRVRSWLTKWNFDVKRWCCWGHEPSTNLLTVWGERTWHKRITFLYFRWYQFTELRLELIAENFGWTLTIILSLILNQSDYRCDWATERSTSFALYIAKRTRYTANEL